MPAALDVDHEQVRAVALQVGVREAARQYGLTEAVVMRWSAQEEWFKHTQVVQDAIVKKQENQGISAVVSKTPSEIISKFKDKTKLSLARVVDKTATGLKRLSPSTLAEKRSGAVLNTVSAYAKLYPDAQVSTPAVNVQILNQVGIPELPP